VTGAVSMPRSASRFQAGRKKEIGEYGRFVW
jgi:hypothetical protein